MRPNRPHIPSSSTVSKSHLSTNNTKRASFLATLVSLISRFSSYNQALPLPLAAVTVAFASVRRCLGREPKTRKRKKHTPSHFLRIHKYINHFNTVAKL